MGVRCFPARALIFNPRFPSGFPPPHEHRLHPHRPRAARLFPHGWGGGLFETVRPGAHRGRAPMHALYLLGLARGGVARGPGGSDRGPHAQDLRRRAPGGAPPHAHPGGLRLPFFPGACRLLRRLSGRGRRAPGVAAPSGRLRARLEALGPRVQPQAPGIARSGGAAFLQ